MIVGGYTLDLYCDAQKCIWVDLNGCPRIGPAQFIGETGGYARRVARHRGWKLDLENDRAFCPTCVKAGLHKCSPE